MSLMIDFFVCFYIGNSNVKVSIQHSHYIKYIRYYVDLESLSRSFVIL